MQVRLFLVDLLTQLRAVIESGQVLVGMVTFADRDYQIFHLNTYQSNFTGLISAVRTVDYVGGGRNTGLGTTRHVLQRLCISLTYCTDVDLFFRRSIVCYTRGSNMKLNKCHIISSRDGHFFGIRVTKLWKSLSDHIVTSPTVACFQHRIAKLKFML